MPHDLRLRDLREATFWLALGFGIVVRIVLGHCDNLVFNGKPFWWQLLDVRLLVDEPLKSLYYLHMQPPLYNGLLAISLALPPEFGGAFLQGLFLAATSVMSAVVYLFLRSFGYRPAIAGALTALFDVLPQVLIFENVFFYPHLEATLVLLATFFAARYLTESRVGMFMGFAICLVALAFLRSLFHLAWVTVALVAIWGLANRSAPRFGALLVAFASIAAVAILYAKNLIEFGTFSASSWQGVSAALTTLPINPSDTDHMRETKEDFRRRAERGEFSPSALLALADGAPWGGWVASAKDCEPGRSQPRAVCAIRRSDGDLNYNHLAMIRYSTELGGDSLHGLRLYPKLFLRHVAASMMTFFGTPSWEHLKDDPTLTSYRHAWNALLVYRPDSVYAPERAQETGLARLLSRLRAASLPHCVLVAIGISIVLFKASTQALRRLRGSDASGEWIFPGVVVTLFVLVPNMVNSTEANRIRYTIEPLLFLALASAGTSIIRQLGGPHRMRTLDEAEKK